MHSLKDVGLLGVRIDVVQDGAEGGEFDFERFHLVSIDFVQSFLAISVVL